MKALIACIVAWQLPVLASQFVSAAAAERPRNAQESSSQVLSGRPLHPPGATARYILLNPTGLPGAVTKSYSVAWGRVELTATGEAQWFALNATKSDGGEFRVWLLTDGYPADTLAAAREHTARFIFQSGESAPREFRNRATGAAVLPSLGAWPYLFPRASGPVDVLARDNAFPRETRFLGHSYQLAAVEDTSSIAEPPTARLYRLLPDLLVGVPSNTRQKDSTRRYDGSDYEPVRLRAEEYREMADAGVNCLKVDRDQLPSVADLDIFYWGVGGKDVPYPECLYDSRYLGPTLFLDEPAVCTRDYVIRPRLAKDPAYRNSLTPQIAFDAFREFFHHVCQEGAGTSLIQGLAARADVNLGDLHFSQANLFSWETMVSTAAYQLSQSDSVPAAMVFEPPGRVGTRRTLPELDMTYGCQIPVDNPSCFIDIIYGFLRGAARLTGKDWGTSIYGAVDRSDAFWFLSHAYDLGATRFFFWDNAQLACVPYDECLRLAWNLKMRAENHPSRNLQELKRAAEVAILLPAGYNLGHVYLGKGDLWGLSELNLERVNEHGVKYRTVMGNFFTEIERCLRLGVAFDLLGEFPNLQPVGYREVIRIREDGKVEVVENGRRSVLDQARVPVRPAGAPPHLEVTLSAREGKSPLDINARATVVETTAPVYYTFGTDAHGVYHNAAVAWELYGPGEEDHRFLTPPGLKPDVIRTGKTFEIAVKFKLDRPGGYRLRAATVDLAGRGTVAWIPINVTE